MPFYEPTSEQYNQILNNQILSEQLDYTQLRLNLVTKYLCSLMKFIYNKGLSELLNESDNFIDIKGWYIEHCAYDEIFHRKEIKGE